jgi:hypothetical protein
MNKQKISILALGVSLVAIRVLLAQSAPSPASAAPFGLLPPAMPATPAAPIASGAGAARTGRVIGVDLPYRYSPEMVAINKAIMDLLAKDTTIKAILDKYPDWQPTEQMYHQMEPHDVAVVLGPGGILLPDATEFTIINKAFKDLLYKDERINAILNKYPAWQPIRPVPGPAD